jgi:hypothetical protein
MQNDTATAKDKNPAVYGLTGGCTPAGDHATSAAIGPASLRTITATAGDILKLLSESKNMELLLIGDLSSSGPDCMTVFDRSGELPCLDETIRRLDNSEIIELKHWERFGDCVFLTYGLGDGIETV